MRGSRLAQRSRREFVKTGLAAGFLAGASRAGADPERTSVAIVADPTDPVAAAIPARWAAAELQRALAAKGITVRQLESLEQAPAGDLCVLVAGEGSRPARQLLEAARVTRSREADSLALVPARAAERSVTVAYGGDVRGAVYALLELADRVAHAGDAREAMQAGGAVVERSPNAIRSATRYFVSDVEDKSWYHDRSFWGDYLTLLATHRFNRFSLGFGLGYNSPSNVRDVYFYFTYPFLFSVPGYSVRAVPLPDAERDKNLETLRFIGEETVKRGLHFQVGLWTHAYSWRDSPHANYTIDGLTPQNHAAYCRDALEKLLKEVPTISGITLRGHSESGIPEGSYDFWRTLFDGVKRVGRRVEIDLHSKGIEHSLLEIALETGNPVNVSPKYWAEHMGLPYHQASIRDLERGREPGPGVPIEAVRRFTRYGYGDYLAEDRRYGVLHRIWPGTQRFLLWGDPAMAAGYGRLANFCGSVGVELSEPLSFKGRIGSGIAGGRNAYADASLRPRHDFEKYVHQYRLWGRLVFNPEANPDTWRRDLRTELKAAAPAAEAALADASRILPLVTTAHGVSGSNNTYWPEVYTNMPIVDETRNKTYRDTPAPRRFGAVSPFDPQLFARVDDFAAELLGAERSVKYSPLDVARWLEDFAGGAVRQLAAAPRAGAEAAAFRRLAADVQIQAGLGRFFARKLRAGVLFAIYEKTGDREAVSKALESYRAARDAWSELAKGPGAAYLPDISYGFAPHLRGHGSDRLAAIDDDIADMDKRLAASPQAVAADPARARRAVQLAMAPPTRPVFACRHSPPARFRPGAPLELELLVTSGGGKSARLRFRRVNQAETWRAGEMTWRRETFQAAIPGDYTQSSYPLQYYFEVKDAQGAPALYPGFDKTLSNQPYFVVRRGETP